MFRFILKNSLCLLLLLCLNAGNLKAADDDIRATPEEQALEELKKYYIPDSISRQAVMVPITSMNFVFTESYGSLESDFLEDLNLVSGEVLRYGIQDSKKAILFIDVQGQNSARFDLDKAERNPEVITREFLYKVYPPEMYKTQRRALVGVLTFPHLAFKGTEKVKLYRFKDIKVYVKQTDFNRPSELVYSKERKMLDRAYMISYMNSASKKFEQSIGMMEMYDTLNDTYTLMDIPGDQAAFLESLGIEQKILEPNNRYIEAERKLEEKEKLDAQEKAANTAKANMSNQANVPVSPQANTQRNLPDDE